MLEMRARPPFRIVPVIALGPAIIAVTIVYIGCVLWTVTMSFTASRSVPDMRITGLLQWWRLFGDRRWNTAMENMFIFGGLYVIGCLVLGYFLAVFVDQRIKGESFFRTVFLCPHALSFIVTGQVWQWLLNPEFGLERFVVTAGWTTFRFRWITESDFALYTIVMAGVWQSVGVAMILMLAGLRGIDEEIWKATRVDGIPKWRTYFSIILPTMAPSVLTCIALLGAAAVKNYDLVVAMTGGGPGISTEVPSKYVMEYLFERSNIGLAAAGATTMLLTTLCIAAPVLAWQAWKKRSGRLA